MLVDRQADSFAFGRHLNGVWSGHIVAEPEQTSSL